MMTENEVIEKLEFFKNAIINLKNELNEKDELIEELSSPPSAIIEENLQERINELEGKLNEKDEIIKNLKSENEENSKTISQYVESCKKLKKESNELNSKSSETIKCLEEKLIDKDKELETINKKVFELEKLFASKNEKEHKMIVKPAEKELEEMIKKES